MQQLQHRRSAWLYSSALVLTGLATALLPAARVTAQSGPGTFKRVKGRAISLHRTIVVNPGVFQVDAPATSYVVPFRPLLNNRALDWNTYAALKQQVALQSTARPGDADEDALIPPPPSTTITVKLGSEHAGGLNLLTSGDASIPSDSILAVANKTAMEETNSEVGFFNKTPNTLPTHTTVKLTLSSTVSGNTFVSVMGGAQTYDPRVVYDYYGTTAHPNGHYIATFNSTSFGTGTGYHQYYYIAVSSSSPDTLPITFKVYAIDLPAIGPPPSTTGGKTTSDFVDVGLDANNLYLTGNFFDNTSGNFLGASILVISKDQIENGTTSPAAEIANGLNGTLTPPFVRQTGATGTAYFIFNEPSSSDASNPADSDIGFYSVSGTPPSATLVGPMQVAVPFYEFPPYAQQPGTYQVLDTSDTRFQDKTTQVGSHVYAVHCVDFGGYPTVRWYEVDGAALFGGTTPVLLNGTPFNVFAASTSNDFDASIAANDPEEVVITWNETLSSRTSPNMQEAVRFTSFVPGTTWGTKNQAGSLVTGSVSPSYSIEFRNGDYSTTVVDPSNPLIFWGVAQNQLDSAHVNWNTWLFDVFFSAP